MTTATLTVTDAEQQLADAQRAESDANTQLQALKDEILENGPQAVTAEALGVAAHAREHAALTVEHARAQLTAAHERARLDQLNQLKQQILDAAGTPDDVLDAWRQLEDAATQLITIAVQRHNNLARSIAALRRAGVPVFEPGGKSRTTGDGRTHTPYTQLSEEHAGMGWSPAAMGRLDAIHIDGRTITDLDPGQVIGAALERAARAAGTTVNHLRPIVDVQTSRSSAIANDVEQWIRNRC